jgi:hypothetical protein
MRDKRFVAIHRGGTLTRQQHGQLVAWACACVKHLLPLASEQVAASICEWLKVALQWIGNDASTGDARKASLKAVAYARNLADPVEEALVRAAGHAVATAHMADHCVRTVQYAWKAVQIKGRSIEAEKQWQYEQLSNDIKEIICPLFQNNVGK